ncbi:MAG TPA: N-acetylglucosamine-6-phosphate deacetylase [Thermoanaerobaculia bacterium]|nr:N-acetylglucosamine-6-phosphate deacetylase [Thermoanaerobaculia bacterium]
MKSRSLHGRAFFGGLIRDHVTVTMAGETIVEVVAGPPPANAERIEGVILPGFIDMHVHGAAGADFMDADSSSVSRITNHHVRHGTTALAATTLSAAPAHLASAVRTIATMAEKSVPGDSEIVGIHLEGPFLSPAKAGAQDVDSLRPADIVEVEELIRMAPGMRWVMTLAPEMDGAGTFIERFHDEMVISIGHTNATFGEALEAFDRGASHVTHLFNAMRPLHHREPGVIGAILTTEDVTAELIADGVHVHPAVLRYFTQALPGRICLVTDAIRACGMPHGTYSLYQHQVTVDDTGARLPNGNLAGSTLTMMQAVCNMVELAGLPLEMIVPLATEVPARVLGVEERKGRLEVGFDADLVIISRQLALERVFARGVEVVAA